MIVAKSGTKSDQFQQFLVVFSLFFGILRAMNGAKQSVQKTGLQDWYKCSENWFKVQFKNKKKKTKSDQKTVRKQAYSTGKCAENCFWD